MTDKEKCIQFHQWVVRQHYVGFPKVVVEGKEYREMTVGELYDYYEALPELQKKTAFLP